MYLLKWDTGPDLGDPRRDQFPFPDLSAEAGVVGTIGLCNRGNS